jgi:hypothetical protein
MRGCLRYVAHVRFTGDEWDMLGRVAEVRRVPIEELIREELGLAPLEAGPSRRSGRRHLRLVRSELAGSCAEDA